jgi:hypothetical protein
MPRPGIRGVHPSRFRADVRSPARVIHMSRSQRRMNHLGSGHVLTNTPASRSGPERDKLNKSPKSDIRRNDSYSPPIGHTQSPRGPFSRKSRQRERFRPGWMLTLVRQLVELEKRRRDYCSDPRESADSGRPLRPLRRSGLPARRPHQWRRAALLRAPRTQVRAGTQEDRCGNTGRDRTAHRPPGVDGRRRALTRRTSDQLGPAGGRTPPGGVRPQAYRHMCWETSPDTAETRVYTPG